MLQRAPSYVLLVPAAERSLLQWPSGHSYCLTDPRSSSELPLQSHVLNLGLQNPNLKTTSAFFGDGGAVEQQQAVSPGCVI